MKKTISTIKAQVFIEKSLFYLLSVLAVPFLRARTERVLPVFEGEYQL